MSLHSLTVSEARELLAKGEVSSEDLTKAMLDRINQVDDKVKAFVTVCADKALAQAQEVDGKLAKGEALGPLAGIPMVLKDNMCTEGVLTSCSSKILQGFVPPYNATVVDKLQEAGAVILGKANMDEFAMGSSTENSGLHKTANPWDLSRVPGGSSGGSAAVVSAGEGLFSLGSDTGGSIRQPASFCGVVGMKPTYGRVSRYGLIAFASSLDQIGPFTKDVTDCANVMNVISGYDPKDSTSANVDLPDFTSYLTGDIKGMRIGIPKEYFVEGMQPEVEQAVKAAIAKFEELGAICEPCSLPHTEYALPTYYLIAPAEASSNLARYDGVRYGYRAEGAEDLISMFKKTRSEGFGAEVKRRIMLGTYALSSGYYDAYYLKAQKVRTLIKQDFDKVYEKFDVLLSPTAPSTAFKFGEKANDPISMYLSDIFTMSVNLAGIPALSMPCGFANGMPIGLQLMGKAFDEGTILKAAYAFEQATDYHKARPNL